VIFIYKSKYITIVEVYKEALYLGPILKELGYNKGVVLVLLSINN